MAARASGPPGGAQVITTFNGGNVVSTQVPSLNFDGQNAGDGSGFSVSLSKDGNIIAIGAVYNKINNNEGTGYVKVLKNESGVWTQIGDDIRGKNDKDVLGYNVSLSSNGNILALTFSLFNSGIRVYENLLP